MAFNKRIYDKIYARCKGDKPMEDFLRSITVFEFSDSKQYTKVYESEMRKYSKIANGEKS